MVDPFWLWRVATQQAVGASRLQAYISCNLAAVRSLTDQTGGLHSLVVAARGFCLREERDLSEELIATKGELQAHRFLQVYRDGVLDGHITEIVKARVRAARQ